MKTENGNTTVLSDTQSAKSAQGELSYHWRRLVGRRSFLQGLGVAGAAALPAGALFAESNKKLSRGDVAILKFLAAAELIEKDLWQQYNELGGAVDANDQPNAGNAAYVAALSNLDGDMPQYISDNTDDEISHAAFLNAYLMSKGEDPVNLSGFQNLQSSSKATGAQQVGRLTNLQSLNVDTSYYFRYRSTQNPDLGATFPQLINIVNQPAIPLHDNYALSTIQAIANVAAFHFAMIEQGGSSLYPTLALQVSSVEVLRIVLSIGGTEIDHFGLWHDKLGNAVAEPLAPLFDPVTGLTFPNFNDPGSQHNGSLSAADQAAGSQIFQTNLILAEPCQFLSPNLPPCSIIRPTSAKHSGAMAAVMGFTADNLFLGQPKAFFDTLMELAEAADGAKRQPED